MNKMQLINVGDKGTFKPSKTFSTSPQDVDAIIAAIEASTAKRVALYFHGGLVSELDGLASAKIINGRVESDDVYPISFVWETGFGETIKERIFQIQQTTLFQKLLKIVLKKVGGKLNLSLDSKGFSSLSDAEIERELNSGGIPFEEYEEMTGFRGANIRLDDDQTFIEEVEAELEMEFADDPELHALLDEIDLSRDLINKDVVETTTTDDSKGIISGAKILKFLAKITLKAIKRYLKGRDHGFYPTVLEEILRELYIADFGAWLWNGMKLKAEEMWLPNTGLTGDRQHAGTYLLIRLNELAARKSIKLDLIGHSAGSIAICHLCNALDLYPNLKVRKIIYLAPACTCDLFAETFIQKPGRFEEFRMFTMTDEAESKDALVNKIPFLYPRSLLYLISGILEDKGESFDKPILGMQRYFDWDYYQEIPVLKTIRTFLYETENRFILSPSIGNLDGLNSAAIDHGAFNENDETLISLAYHIKS